MNSDTRLHITMSGVNLARILFGNDWNDYMVHAADTKMPAAEEIQTILNAFVGGDRRRLKETTFQYIVSAMEMGVFDYRIISRLDVACADFGYPVEELQRLHREGKSAVDVAREIISRGPYRHTDD